MLTDHNTLPVVFSMQINKPFLETIYEELEVSIGRTIEPDGKFHFLSAF